MWRFREVQGLMCVFETYAHLSRDDLQLVDIVHCTGLECWLHGKQKTLTSQRILAAFPVGMVLLPGVLRFVGESRNLWVKRHEAGDVVDVVCC